MKKVYRSFLGLLLCLAVVADGPAMNVCAGEIYASAGEEYIDTAEADEAYGTGSAEKAGDEVYGIGSAEMTGNEAYGIGSAERAGDEAYGIESAERAGNEAYGVDTGEAAETEANGTDAAEAETYGSDAAEAETYGSDAAEAEAYGTDAAEAEAYGTDAVESEMTEEIADAGEPEAYGIDTGEPEAYSIDTADPEESIDAEAEEEAYGIDAAGRSPSGYCGGDGDGTNLAWKITGRKGNYKLVIEGSGRMKQGGKNGILSPSISYPGNWGSFAGSVTEIQLPDGITSIGGWAFYGFKKLAKVTIPNSVNYIGMGAFENCVKLSKITIPGSVATVSDWAFEGCEGLSDLTIENGVANIYSFAFEHCSKLESLYIPSSVTNLGYKPFAYCSSLSEITVNGSNPVYESRNNCIITKDTHELHTGCNYSVIPDDVTAIGSAFCGCSFTEIDIPGNVTRIDSVAFMDCAALTEISIPDSVISIGEQAFDGCTGLTSVIIGENVDEINLLAFEGCSSLKSVFIPAGIQNIGASAFSHTSQFVVFYSGTASDWNNIDIVPDALESKYESNTDTICKRARVNNSKEIITEFHDGHKVSYLWSPDFLLSGQKGADKAEAISALLLCRATYFNADEVDSTLMKLGLIDVINDQSRWAYAYNDNGVAHTIGLKKYGQYNIITVAIRGSSNGEDWARVNAFPAGFVETAAHITDDMKTFLNDRGVNWNDENNRFFITGHSMGGAVAGDIAKRIETHDSIDKSRISCYTFASPYNVYDSIDYYGNHNPWYYIHNIVNTGDIVPFVAQPGTVQIRWGEDFYLPPVSTETFTWYRYLTGESFNPYDVLINHKLEVYLSEMLTNDAYDVHYDIEKRIAVIRCPVDVEILDRYGRTVGRIIDNTVQDGTDERIMLCVIGDEKFVVLPAKEEYELRLTGTDTGTMSYEITDYTSVGSGTEAFYETGIFENVTLETGKQMSSSIGSDMSADDVRLYVLDEDGQAAYEVNEDGTEQAVSPGFDINGIDPAGYTYTGSAIKPKVEVSYHEMRLKVKKDYTVSYDKNVNVTDKAVITVNGKGNYKGKETETFKIVAKDIGSFGISVSEIASVAYNKKKNYRPVPKINYGKKKLKINKDFTISYYPDEECLSDPVTPKAPGKYYARVTGIKNFTGFRVIAFEIADSGQIPVSSLTVAKIDDQPYRNGSKLTPYPTVKKGNTILTRDIHYTLSWGTNTEVGTGTVTITGIAPYVGTRTVSFKITGTAMSRVTIKNIPESYVYDGTARTPVPNIINPDKGNSLAASVRCATEEEYESMTESQRRQVGCIFSYSNNINVGKATVTMRGINACYGTVKKSFVIRPFVITDDPEDAFDISLEKESYPYVRGGVRPKPVVSFGGIPLKEGRDYSLSYANNTSVNNAGGKKKPSVRVKGKGNFKGSATALIFRIERADLAASGVKLTAKDVAYKNKAGNFKTGITLTGPDGKALKAGKDYDNRHILYTYDEAGTEAVPSNAKVYPGITIYVKVNAKGSSYTGSVTGKYRVTEYDIGKLTASVASKTYTGKKITIDPGEITWKSGKKKVDGVTFEIDASTYKNNIKKGKATVTVRGTGSYGGCATVTFRIGARGFRWWWRD